MNQFPHTVDGIKRARRLRKRPQAPAVTSATYTPVVIIGKSDAGGYRRRHFSLRGFAVVTGVLLLAALVAAGSYAQASKRQYDTFVPAHTMVGTMDVGGVKRSDLSALLTTRLSQTAYIIAINGQTERYTASDLGLAPDIAAITREVNDIGWIKSLQSGVRVITLQPKYVVDDAKLKSASDSIAAKASSAAVAASFSLEDGHVKASEPKAAVAYVGSTVAEAVKSAVGSGKQTVSVPVPKTDVEANKTALAAAVAQMDKRLAATTGVTVGGTAYPATVEQRYRWLSVTAGQNDSYVVATNRAEVASFVKDISAKVAAPATPTIVTLVDGAETGRTPGRAGTSLNVDPVTDQLVRNFEGATSGLVGASLTPIASPIAYQKSYTKTSNGLTHLMNDFDDSHVGKFGIALQEITGSRSAYHLADDRFVTASIFKAFVATAVLRRVDSSLYTMSTSTSTGTLQSSLENMILASDNDTAYSLIKLYGFTTLDPALHQLGFNATTVDNYTADGTLFGDKYTTPRDVVSLFTRLQNGELLSTGERDFLFELMSRQAYRNGIPAGSSPSRVADKVGFLGPWIHDAGIVYGPQSTYSLTILTNGGTWSDIADLSRQIYRLMN